MDIAQLGISVDSRQVKGATADLDNFSRSGARAEGATAGVTSATQAFGSALASLGIAAATTQLVKMADTYGLLQSKIGLATGEIEKAAAATDMVFQAAQRARVGMDELGSMVARLAPSIKDMGGTTTDAVAASELFAKTLKISGATAAETASAILQFGQALGTGRLGGEEFNAVNESSGRYMQLLAKELGVTRGELKKMAEEGKLTSDVLIDALANNSSILESEFQRLRLTGAETFEQLSNSTMQAAFEIDKASGVSQTFNGIMNAGRGIIDAVTLALRDTNSTASDTSIIIPAVTTVFQTLSVVANETIYVFRETGRTLGALAAQAAALAQGDLDLWRRIGEERDKDSAAARVAVDKMTASILSSETATAKLSGTAPKLSTGLKAVKVASDDAAKSKSAAAKAAREMEKAYKEAAKASEDFGNAVKRARESALESAIRQADAVEELVKRAEEEAKTHGMNAEALAQYNLAQAEAAVVTARAAGIAEERIQQLEREVEARRELVGLTSSAARRDEAAETKKATEQAAADMGKSVQGTLAEAIKAGLGDANPIMGFAKALGSSVKNSLMNAVANGLAARLATVVGAGGLSASASASTGGAGAGGFMSSIGSLFGGNSIGESLASGSLGGEFGIFANAGNVSNLALAGYGLAGGLFGKLVGGGQAGSTGGSLGAGLGALAGFGPWGIAASALGGTVLGGLLGGSWKGKGGAKTGGFASTGAMDRLYTPSQADASLAKVVGGVTDSIGALAKSLGVTAGGFNVGLGFDTDPQGKAGNRVSSRLLDSAGRVIYESINRQVEDAQAGVAVEAQRLALAAIKSSNLPEEFARAFGGVAIAEATDEQVASITAQLQAIKAVKDVFDTVGAAMTQLKGLGYEARESLVALAGGVENLTAGLASYYQNFYTDAERANASTEQLRKQFSDMGMTLPATREAFRQLVEAQDLTTEAGRKMYAQLIGLSGAFVQSADAAKSAMQSLLQGSLSGLSASISAQSDAIGAAADKAVSAYQEQIRVQQELAKTAGATVSRLQGVVDVLSNGLREIRGYTFAQGRALISSALQSGTVPDAEALGIAVDAIRSLDEDQFSTRIEFERARGQAAADMDALQSLTKGQLSTAERQLQSAEAQASKLQMMIDEIVKSRDQQLKALQDIYTSAQDQVNAALGIQNAVLSVEAAVRALAGALGSVGGSAVNGGGGTASSGLGSIAQIYKDVLGREADVGGLNFYGGQLMGGKSIEQIRAEIAASPEAMSRRPEMIAGDRMIAAQSADSAGKINSETAGMSDVMKKTYIVMDRMEQVISQWNNDGMPEPRGY